MLKPPCRLSRIYLASPGSSGRPNASEAPSPQGMTHFRIQLERACRSQNANRSRFSVNPVVDVVVCRGWQSYLAVKLRARYSGHCCLGRPRLQSRTVTTPTHCDARKAASMVPCLRRKNLADSLGSAPQQEDDHNDRNAATEQSQRSCRMPSETVRISSG